MEWDWQNFLSFWAIFCPFTTPIMTLKIKFLKKNEKKKKNWKYMWTVNEDHKVQQTKFFVILGHFLPFTLLTPEKSKFWKKRKKHLEILSFYRCTINDNHTMYGSWDIERNRTFCHFGPFFALLLPLKTQKSKAWKNEKTTCKYYHFIQVYHKWQSYDVWFLRYWMWQTEFVILDHFLPFYPTNNRKN